MTSNVTYHLGPGCVRAYGAEGESGSELASKVLFAIKHKDTVEAAKNARRSPAAQKRRHRRFSADLGGAAHVGEDVVAGTLGAYAGTFDEGQFVIGNVIDFDLDSGTYTIA